jgi:lipopolysaccharide export system protein LptC
MKKNDYTIFLLVAAGLGIYWLYRKNQNVPPVTATPATPMDQSQITTNTVSNTGYDVRYVINGMKRISNVPNTI